MKLAYFSLTPGGDALCYQLAQVLPGEVVTRQSLKDQGLSFSNKVRELWPALDGFIFVMAAGIVVRTIAPLITSKDQDPAVVVMDSRGNFAVSLLSGHLGGANDLARNMAGITGGQPVITTGTDVEQTLAFDLFARENHMEIENLEAMKYVSGAMIAKEPVHVWCPWRQEWDFPENVHLHIKDLDWDTEEKDHTPGVFIGQTWDEEGLELDRERTVFLRPCDLFVGVGCKKNVDPEEMEKAFLDFLNKNGVTVGQVAAVATIPLKKEEPAITKLCQTFSIRKIFIDSEPINALESQGKVGVSEFVRSVTGVASVSEGCALSGAAGKDLIKKDKDVFESRLVCQKTRYPGITFALAQRRHRKA
ncbi:cobalt-precorrin 5A hydrolase [Catenibacillus scindens]|uniref:Cobalt-precorrin 5A hydrolase n=1 Tax=Catenibacillus scindens TaxID=673271 RepID=A0A7W8HCG4_9FIRM|nr:cobalt-precorrin 5A hydrolase [Catenibacillus scindens]MBB5265941.1 cobalt-precorrin 5A hydrolase [Catenibacillus scindens]